MSMEVRNATVPTSHPLNLALRGVRLMQSQAMAPEVLSAFAEVTGMPAAVLLQIERRVAQAGSLMPLRDALRNPMIPKVEGLRYDLEVRNIQRQGPPGGGRRRVQQMLLSLSSGHGQVQLSLTVALSGRPVGRGHERQIGRIKLCYKIVIANTWRVVREELTLVSERQAPRLTPAHDVTGIQTKDVRRNMLLPAPRRPLSKTLGMMHKIGSFSDFDNCP